MNIRETEILGFMLPWRTRMSIPERDRISHLPDEILLKIVTVLPLKDAARTSILSRRWRYMWKAMPRLELDESLTVKWKKKSEERLFPFWYNRKIQLEEIREWLLIVYKILCSRCAPIQSCVISASFFENCKTDIDGFLQLLIQCGIKELEFWNFPGDCYQVPEFLLTCESLRDLKLVNCILTISPSFKDTMNLKTLHLHNAIVNDDLLESLISSSKHLENLTVIFCSGLTNLNVGAPKLLALNVFSEMPVNICLKDVGSLVSVSLSFAFPKDNASKIATTPDCLLGNLIGVEKLSLRWREGISKCWAGECGYERLSTQFLNLKRLTVELDPSNPKDIAFFTSLLRNSPYLQEIDIWICRIPTKKTMTEQVHWEIQSTFDCLFHHIKIIRINNLHLYCENAVGLVKFLLTNASVLKTMTVRYLTNLWNASVLKNTTVRSMTNLSAPSDKYLKCPEPKRIIDELMIVQRASSSSHLYFYNVQTHQN